MNRSQVAVRSQPPAPAKARQVGQDEPIDLDKIPAIPNPGKFLMDKGFLFILNLYLMHQYGYGLSVDPDTDKLEVLDFRKFPKAAIFEVRIFKEGKAKWDKFLKEEGYSFHKIRKVIFGFTVQLKADWREQKRELELANRPD